MELGLGLIWFAVWIVALTCHEAAHGFAALKLGDPTAYRHGQVTLDPIAHIKREPFGTIILPIISFVAFGWMLGWASAPYDPIWARHNRRKAGLMALAGPAANLLLVLIAGLAVRAGIVLGLFTPPQTITFTQVTVASSGGWAGAAAVAVSILFSLNLILFVFNLLPLPPLDGSQVVTLLLSDRAAERYSRLVYQPGFRIMGLIIAWNLVGLVLGPVHGFALRLLYPGLGYY